MYVSACLLPGWVLCDRWAPGLQSLWPRSCLCRRCAWCGSWVHCIPCTSTDPLFLWAGHLCPPESIRPCPSPCCTLSICKSLACSQPLFVSALSGCGEPSCPDRSLEPKGAEHPANEQGCRASTSFCVMQARACWGVRASTSWARVQSIQLIDITLYRRFGGARPPLVKVNPLSPFPLQRPSLFPWAMWLHICCGPSRNILGYRLFSYPLMPSLSYVSDYFPPSLDQINRIEYNRWIYWHLWSKKMSISLSLSFLRAADLLMVSISY